MDKSKKLSKIESLKEFGEVCVWILKTYFKMSPYRMSLFLLSSAVGEAGPLFQLFITSKIIDKIIGLAQNNDASLKDLYLYLGILLVYEIIDNINFSINRYTRRTLSNISKQKITQIYYHQLNNLGIQNLENPDTINTLKRADSWLEDTMYQVQSIVSIIAAFVTAIIAGLIIFTFLPILVPISIIAVIARFFNQGKYNRQHFDWQSKNTEKYRMAWVSADLLRDPRSLLEINTYNSFSFFNRKFDDLMSYYFKGLLLIIRKSEIARAIFNTTDTLIKIASYAFIFTQAIAGNITIGTVFIEIRAIDNFISHIKTLVLGMGDMYDVAIKMTDLVKVLNMKPAIPDGKIKISKLVNPPVIELKKVRFAYPKSDKYIFDNFSLKINAGEKVAIVGKNGAGKTTLVKLLTRTYAVKAGEILIDSININDMKIDSLYKNIGVLFQEYTTFEHLTVKENICLGDLSTEPNENRMVEAAVNADADGFISNYEKGYNQILSEKYEGGIRPSTGQKQKIALARFFYRNAPLAIFDEPTSAIDAVSEYNIFNKIYSFFKDKTVVIISHRFSTVRNADRIIVLDEGKIVEEGSHQTLMEIEGVYAKAFKLQAEGYQS